MIWPRIPVLNTYTQQLWGRVSFVYFDLQAARYEVTELGWPFSVVKWRNAIDYNQPQSLKKSYH